MNKSVSSKAIQVFFVPFSLEVVGWQMSQVAQDWGVSKDKGLLVLKTGNCWANQDKLITIDLRAIWFLSCFCLISQVSPEDKYN